MRYNSEEIGYLLSLLLSLLRAEPTLARLCLFWYVLSSPADCEWGIMLTTRLTFISTPLCSGTKSQICITTQNLEENNK